MDKLSQLNLTSELDLLDKHPNLNYLFLPFDTTQFNVNNSVHSPVRVCHSPTNQYYKGSGDIIPVCKKLEDEGLIEFILIENQSYETVIKQKQSCDVLIDQIHNRGGWGYGMNSVEGLSMGLVCITELVQSYRDFIPDHPFIDITKKSLEITLRELIKDKRVIIEKKKISKAWVEKKHGLEGTRDALYSYYEEKGWI